MDRISRAVLLLALPLLTACGGSKLIFPDAVTPPKTPVRLMATDSLPTEFSASLTTELDKLGYGVIDQVKTAALLRKLDLENSDLNEPQILSELSTRRIDAVLKIAAEVKRAITGVDVLVGVRVSVRGTDGGLLLASLAWTNAWSGASGSLVDAGVKKSIPDAARDLALVLSRQLGPPGPKAAVYIDDVLAARKSMLTGVQVAAAPPAKREPSSDIDAPARMLPERPDDIALVIGIEDYQSVPNADYGLRDAKTAQRHLEALGFPSRNIVSLTGSEATASKLRGYFEEWLPLNVKPNSNLFVYYSGHGAPDVQSGDAYLVPWDGDPKFLKSTALPLKKIYADLSKTKAKRVIVALDACFSGAGGRSVLAKGARPLVGKIVDAAPVGANMTILAAASGDEITGSLDEQGHGMFTYHLFKGLAADPKSSADSLFKYLTPRVQDDARRQNRVQTPVLAGALSGPLLP